MKTIKNINSKYKITCILGLIFLLTACSIYKLPIAQGKHMNMAEMQQYSKALSSGMSASTVLGLLGEPNYRSSLETVNTWHYIYNYAANNGEPTLNRQIILAWDSKNYLKNWQVCYNIPKGLSKQQAISHLGNPLNQDLKEAVWHYRLAFSKQAQNNPKAGFVFDLTFNQDDKLVSEGSVIGNFCARLP
ncbi:MAG: outer membrane protein assembly factor BamE [Gammaproteobacteria bacterium]